MPKRNIFSVAVKLNKLELLKEAGIAAGQEPDKEKAAAADLVRGADNMRNILLGMRSYNDTNGRPLTPVFADKGGKPLLSWRVYLLPFVENNYRLYDQFKLDEPWDSPNNKKLIDKMPAVFRAPNSKAGEGKTTYLLPVGKGAAFSSGDSKLRVPLSFPDGMSTTIMLVDAADENAVVWTKPEDLKYDASDPLKGLAVRNGKEFLAGFEDGRAHAISKSSNKDTLRAAFAPPGGDVIGFGPDEDRVIRERPPVPLSLPALSIPGLPREKVAALKVEEFLTKGIGNQVGLHVCDAVPTFDFNLPQFLGLAMGNFNGRRGNWELMASFLITSLDSPVYVSVPVQDAKVVDVFLDSLDLLMAQEFRGKKGDRFLQFDLDFYKAPLKPDGKMRVAAVQFGPVKWRMFWARIGNGLYIASKAFILEDLVAAEAERAKAGADKNADRGPTAHGMVRVRAANWDRVLADYRLAWAEGNREACLNNLGPLASVGRAVVAKGEKERPEEDLGRAAHREADRLYGAHFFCPEGGHYLLAPDGKTCRCSAHGSFLDPKQGTEPSEKGSASALKGLSDVTASLTFLKDGLHAVVEIDRKP